MCDHCGCQNHQHISIALPLSYADDADKVQKLQTALNALHGINDAVAQIKEGQITFTMTEHGNMQEVTACIESISKN